MIKRVLLGVAVACAFLVGYAGASHAWPGVPDRTIFRGYFFNNYDDNGDDIFPGGMPSYVNSADSMIAFINTKLASASGRDQVGAAFIIQTMIGNSRNRPPSAAERAEWESRLRYADSVGRIQWNAWFNYTVNSYWQGCCGGGGNLNDDAFYYETSASTSIVFTNPNGSVAYAIRRACANPVGNLSAIPPNPQYTISGRSTVSAPTVVPGNTISFTHYIRNNGPASVPNVWWRTLNPANGQTDATGGPNGYGPGQESQAGAPQSVLVPIGTAVGTQICRYIYFEPLNNGGGGGSGSPACSTVVASFDLTPSVQPSALSAQEGDTITFNYIVNNAGPTETGSVTCKPVGNSYPSGHTPLAQQDADRTSDAGYTPPGTTCPQSFASRANVTVASEAVVVGGQSPGSTICRSLVINPRNSTGGTFRASAEVCVVIAKTPYAHFLGGDVWAGGGFASDPASSACTKRSKITTSARKLSDNSFAGSGSEYGAFAMDRITKFGSAGSVMSDPTAAGGKGLTFANFTTANPADLGYYGAAAHCIDDYYSRFSQTTGDPVTFGTTVDVGGSQGSGVWRLSGNYTFHGTMKPGVTQVYVVENGKVTIDADIKYPVNYNGTGEIPSLIIISYIPGAASGTFGNIEVLSGVQQMDGIFVAKNTFSTCDLPGVVTNTACNKMLTINGAVIARAIALNRTYGGEGATPTLRREPGERFNLSSEVYLRNALNNSSKPTITTTDSRELPPRF